MGQGQRAERKKGMHGGVEQDKPYISQARGLLVTHIIPVPQATTEKSSGPGVCVQQENAIDQATGGTEHSALPHHRPGRKGIR